MIEKLKEHDIIDPKTDKVIGKIGCDLREIMDKLDEVIDTVNTIQKEREAEWFEIQEWISILEAVRKSVNVHEKQIDKLQMKLEPEKCKTPPENVQKIDIGELAYLQKENSDLKDELERTRKALYLAFEMLKDIKNDPDTNDELTQEIADRLDEITVLKQKDN